MALAHEDRQAIEGLFGRLGDVERQAGPRDAEADALISERVARQPGAPYFMAQTIVMQDYALKEAERRIAELERQASSRPAGGLFSGLFGGGQPPRAAPAEQPAPPMQPGRGGGFLAGAAQTAMGVAGGVLIGNAVAGLFSGGTAEAAEPAAPEPPAEAPAAEEGGGFFDGLFGGDDEF